MVFQIIFLNRFFWGIFPFYRMCDKNGKYWILLVRNHSLYTHKNTRDLDTVLRIVEQNERNLRGSNIFHVY
jgi:hypothetical protein